ncbi:hypothetical protein [Streptomyces cinereoruber]|uniref:hypothetical protein n=1 Tax=Streptomyces cinereoruber TaxID=67260 RepID=UPI003C30E87D
MTARPLPPHGTYARAKGSRGYRAACLCDPCNLERRRAEKRSRINRERGIVSFVDPAAAQAHLRLLHETMAWDDMAEAIGLPLSNLNLIYAGRRTKIRPETEAKILATVPRLSGTQLIDATGSTRRIQALLYVGHSLRTIAAECGTARMRIHKLSIGAQEGIRRRHADHIAKTYKRLAFQPPERTRFTVRTMNAAKARGWHGPLAWDDIDDPACVPDAGAADSDNRDELAAYRRSEIQRLHSFRVSEQEIAQRLGMSEHYVHDLIRCLDTAAELRRRRAVA